MSIVIIHCSRARVHAVSTCSRARRFGAIPYVAAFVTQAFARQAILTTVGAAVVCFAISIMRFVETQLVQKSSRPMSSPTTTGATVKLTPDAYVVALISAVAVRGSRETLWINMVMVVVEDGTKQMSTILNSWMSRSRFACLPRQQLLEDSHTSRGAY